MQTYEMRSYVTFYDERDQELARVQLTPGKIAIPLDAAYLRYDVEITEASSGGGI